VLGMRKEWRGQDNQLGLSLLRPELEVAVAFPAALWIGSP